MITTTTDVLSGRSIRDYLGIVFGHSVIAGASFAKQFRSGIRDLGGAPPHDYAAELEHARGIAMQQMLAHAEALGANAVIGIDLDFETSGESSHLVIVSLTGTAVVVD